MKLILTVFGLAFVLVCVDSNTSSPKVQVYSKGPGWFGKDNTLICHVSGFHPPDISIELLKDRVVIPHSQQTDLAFEKTWQFHLTKSAPFTPQDREEYACRVKHQGGVKDYSWEPDM